MKNRTENTKKVEKNIARVLADVPIDPKQERDQLLKRMQEKYGELSAHKAQMSPNICVCIEELGELIELLGECESWPPQTRSD